MGLGRARTAVRLGVPEEIEMCVVAARGDARA